MHGNCCRENFTTSLNIAPGVGDDQVLEGSARDPEAGGPHRRVHAQGQGKARQVGQAARQDDHKFGEFAAV